MKPGLCGLRCGSAGAVVAAGLVLVTGAAKPAVASLFGSKDAEAPQWGLDAAKTPTPADAGDAESVVLYDEYVETIDAQGRATEREREAVRILKPQGRADAGCVVHYGQNEKIDSFREWTLTADGKTFAARDTDFADVGDDTGIPVELSAGRNRVVRPPAADVGATVLCESEEAMAPYMREKDWFTQSTIPVVFQALEIDLPAGAALAARMTVEWGDAAVAGIDNQWHALGQWFTTLEAGRTDPSTEITAQTQQLIAGTTDFYGKLAAITSYIQKNVRYFIVVRGIGGLQAHYAGDIFRNRYGDCKDKTTLLISMLQVAGIHAFYVPVDDRRGVVDPKDPSLVGDHMITAIEIPAGVHDARLQAVVTAADGRRYLIFDPTNERTPVGNLPSYEQGGYGLLAAGAASQAVALPVLPPEANGTKQTGKFSLAADGTLTGSVNAAHLGPEGADYRMLLKYSDEKERHDAWETRVARDLPGVTLDSLAFVQPDALDKPVEFHYAVTAHGYAHTAGTLVLVRPRVVGSDERPCDDKPRTLPVDLEATGSWHDSFDIALPAGYAVDELPDAVDVDTDFASYHAKTWAAGNVLHYEREYVVRKVEIPASEWGAFRRMEGAIGEDEQAAAVLKRQ